MILWKLQVREKSGFRVMNRNVPILGIYSTVFQMQISREQKEQNEFDQIISYPISKFYHLHSYIMKNEAENWAWNRTKFWFLDSYRFVVSTVLVNDTQYQFWPKKSWNNKSNFREIWSKSRILNLKGHISQKRSILSRLRSRNVTWIGWGVSIFFNVGVWI